MSIKTDIMNKNLDIINFADLTPNYVPTLIRELSTFFIQQSGRQSVAEPGGLQLAPKAAGVLLFLDNYMMTRTVI
jgi:hypothetical protein